MALLVFRLERLVALLVFRLERLVALLVFWLERPWRSSFAVSP